MTKKAIKKAAIKIQNQDSKGGGKIRPISEAIAQAIADRSK